MWLINSGYNPNKQNPSKPPKDAVVAKAADNNLVNSLAILSYFWSPPLNPTISTMTANIGTPSTNAANIRRSKKTTQPPPGESTQKTVLFCPGPASSSSTVAVA